MGTWWMVDDGGTRYAIIVPLAIETDAGPVPRYRAVTGETEGRRLIGYYGTLRAACAGAHAAYVAESKPGLSSAYGRTPEQVRPSYPLAAVEYERMQRDG